MDLKLIAVICLLSFAFGMSELECNVKGCQSCNAPNVCAIY